MDSSFVGLAAEDDVVEFEVGGGGGEFGSGRGLGGSACFVCLRILEFVCVCLDQSYETNVFDIACSPVSTIFTIS